MKNKKLISGKRVIAPSKFCFLDGSWGAKATSKHGHRLYGICTMDYYAFFHKGFLDDPIPVPDEVCDRRFNDKPECWHLRHKEQFAPVKKLWRYHTNPMKSYKLYPFMLKTCNEFLAKIGRHLNITNMPVLEKGHQFKLHSIVTVTRGGDRCLWRSTTKAEDDEGNPIRVPVLAEINGADAATFSYTYVLNIAGSIAVDECTMTSRAINTPVCIQSSFAKR